MTTFLLRSSFVLFLGVALTSCVPPRVDARGHVDISRKLEQIRVGETDREGVLALLGSPSTASQFGDEAWYYVTARKESVAFMKPELKRQRVARILFDAEGKVARIEHFGLENSAKFAVADEVTPTEGQSLGFFEQILGNLGRFNNPAGRAGSTGAATGGPGRR